MLNNFYKSLGIVGIFFFIICFMAVHFAEASNCKGPSKEIQVTVEQNANNPALYEFTITNRSNAPIYIFELGSKGGGEYELTWAPKFIPEEGFAPPGWKYREGITLYESNDIAYVWLRKDIKKKNQGITTTHGFKLEMPGPIDTLKNLSFNVSLYGQTNCAWGTVQAQ